MITNLIITTEEELMRVFRNILLEFGLEQKEETIGAEEAMKIIGCTQKTLYFHISQNGLPRLGKGKLRFLRSEVVAWNKRRAEEKQKEKKAKKDNSASLLTKNHEFIKAQLERPKNNR